MDLKKAEKFLDGRIEELKKAHYMFQSIVQPRAERDREILEKMREQRLKLAVLMEKKERGEEITQDEFHASVPVELR